MIILIINKKQSFFIRNAQKIHIKMQFLRNVNNAITIVCFAKVYLQIAHVINYLNLDYFKKKKIYKRRMLFGIYIEPSK